MALLLSLDCPTYSWYVPYNSVCLAWRYQEAFLWVYGTTPPGIKPRSPGPLMNTLTIMLMSQLYIVNCSKYFLHFSFSISVPLNRRHFFKFREKPFVLICLLHSSHSFGSFVIWISFLNNSWNWQLWSNLRGVSKHKLILVCILIYWLVLSTFLIFLKNVLKTTGSFNHTWVKICCLNHSVKYWFLSRKMQSYTDLQVSLYGHLWSPLNSIE